MDCESLHRKGISCKPLQLGDKIGVYSGYFRMPVKGFRFRLRLISGTEDARKPKENPAGCIVASVYPGKACSFKQLPEREREREYESERDLTTYLNIS